MLKKGHHSNIDYSELKLLLGLNKKAKDYSLASFANSSFRA